MKHINIVTVLFFLLSILNSVIAKDYQLNEIQIQARLSAEGTLRIEESRTYVFNGSFSWADYRLPLEKLGHIENFQLFEEEVRFSESQGEEPGSYSTTISADEFYVKWFYQAKNEKRTFKLIYEVTDAVTVYNDVAEFYYKFVGEDNTRQVDKVEIWLDLPQSAGSDQVKAWAHGPLHGLVSFQNGHLFYSISPLPAHHYWEARVIFPFTWIVSAGNRIDEDHESRVLQEEARWADEANRKREQAIRDTKEMSQRTTKARQIGLALCGGGLLIWFFLFIQYGRAVDIPYTQKIDPNYPQDMPPALVSALYYNKQVYTQALSSTLFDLARRGFISLEQNTPPAKKWWQSSNHFFLLKLNRTRFDQERSGLLDFEQDLLLFLFDQLAAGSGEISSDKIKKESSQVRAWFRKWSKILQGHYQSISLYESVSKKATAIAVVFSILIIIAAALAAIWIEESASIAILGGVVCLGISFTILRYTPELKLKKKQWQAFRRYLRTFHISGEDISQKLLVINQYLVYGLALGLGEKELRNLIGIVPESKSAEYFPWFIGGTHGPSGTVNLASALSSMVSIASSTFSSAAGAGGGASAGAGAGAGGASGGAG